MKIEKTPAKPEVTEVIVREPAVPESYTITGLTAKQMKHLAIAVGALGGDIRTNEGGLNGIYEVLRLAGFDWVADREYTRQSNGYYFNNNARKS